MAQIGDATCQIVLHKNILALQIAMCDWGLPLRPPVLSLFLALRAHNLIMQVIDTSHNRVEKSQHERDIESSVLEEIVQ